MNLGGFEVRSSGGIGQGAAAITQISRVADAGERLRRFAGQLLPIYAGLTGVLWGALVIAGEVRRSWRSATPCRRSRPAASPPSAGSKGAGSGAGGEVVILLFLVFALSRVTYVREERPDGWRSIPRDAELRMAAGIIGSVGGLLFLRHWFGAFDLLRASATSCPGRRRSGAGSSRSPRF
jgi:trk system potassium uptake protein